MPPGYNGLCNKEFSKPPVSKKEKQQKLEARRNAAAAKAAKRAKEEEEEAEAKAKEEEGQDPAEREAELARAQELEKKQANAKQLQKVNSKAVKACSSNNWKQALALYTECIDIDASDHLHWSNRALVQNKLGRYEEMLEDATRCVELSPEFSKGWARVGTANVALERFDAAEEAFKRVLALEPESAAAQEGLTAVEKGREAAVQEDAFDVQLRELKLLDPVELRARALEEGVQEDKVKEAERKKDVREALVSLITAHRYIIDLVHDDLAELDFEGLRGRALEEGLDEEQVAAAANRDDPREALQALLVEYLSHDLVGAATEILAEAEFQEVSDDEEEAGVEDLDFEIVVVDDVTELELGSSDVFLAGAYIDETYGDLVLPTGTRLGHRSMHKYYKQRLRPHSDRQTGFRSARLDMMKLHGRVEAQIARQQKWKTENRIVGTASKTSRDAFTSTAVRKWRTELHNMKMWHHLHMWGGGGGGSHYWGAGSKQYNKGNKVKGVVLRHSRQGAKLQAARNKSNRSDASFAVLR